MSPKYEIPVFLQTAVDAAPEIETRAKPDLNAEITAITKRIREHLVVRDQLRADQKLLQQRLKDLQDLERKETEIIDRLRGERSPLYDRQARQRKKQKE
jgi:hypothetical protein